MIRLATRYDIPRLLEIVEAYAYENPIKKLQQEHNHFPRYVEELLFSIIQGRGFIIVLVTYRDWETDRKSTRLNSSH